MAKRETIKSVTKFIREQTGDQEVELVRGKGYHYFTGGKANHFYDQSVMILRLNDVDRDFWLGEYQRLEKNS